MTFQKKIIGLAAALTSTVALADPTPITFWHAMPGPLGVTVKHIAQQFNQSQQDFELKAIYKGTYDDTMTAAISAFRAKEQPDIVQIAEVGTATMMHAKGAIIPVYQLMQDQKINLSSKQFIPAIASYYSDTKQRLYAMPFNSSTAVAFYNKDKIKNFPETWQELGDLLTKRIKAGDQCGFTSGYQSWVQIENFAAWNNLPMATKDNGFGGLGARLLINKPGIVNHIAMMNQWRKDKRFVYGGRLSKSLTQFMSGRCGIYMGSSGSLASVRHAKFDFGVAMLPYDNRLKGAPQNSIIGGAALWALTGHSDKRQQGVAKFFEFLASAKIQAEWSSKSGYLPVTTAAYQLLQKQGYYQKHPDLKTPIKQLTNKPPKPYTMGIRLGNMPQIRDIINGELEAVWSGKKTAQQALDAAVKQGNQQLEHFQSLYQ